MFRPTPLEGGGKGEGTVRPGTTTCDVSRIRCGLVEVEDGKPDGRCAAGKTHRGDGAEPEPFRRRRQRFTLSGGRGSGRVEAVTAAVP